jgi:hypothetical protein
MTSYASDYMVFQTGGASLPATFVDGTSNTMILMERFANPTQATGSIAPHTWSGVTPSTVTTYGVYGTSFISPAGVVATASGISTGNITGPQIGIPYTSASVNDAAAQGCSTATCMVGMADGSVRGVSSGVTATAWAAASTPQGGDLFDSSW